jgi:hypothetical protein
MSLTRSIEMVLLAAIGVKNIPDFLESVDFVLVESRFARVDGKNNISVIQAFFVRTLCTKCPNYMQLQLAESK